MKDDYIGRLEETLDIISERLDVVFGIAFEIRVATDCVFSPIFKLTDTVLEEVRDARLYIQSVRDSKPKELICD